MHVPTRPLIFDDAHVPRARRLWLALLTVCAWTVWLRLWWPVARGVWRHAFAADAAASAVEPGVAQFLDQLHACANFFGVMWLGCAAWFLVRHRHAGARAAAPDDRAFGLSSRQLAAGFALEDRLLRHWQTVQVAVAHHAEDTGWLCHLEPQRAHASPL